ncbi:MAG: hypothetical protein ABEK42_15060, partial [Thiohalorhabdaceae bacterium]
WVPLVGVRAGISAWHGDTGQRQAFDGGRPDVPLTLADVHAQWDRGPWRVRGVYAEARIGDTGAVNRYLQDPDGDPGSAASLLDDLVGAVPKRMTGWYLEAGYDVLVGDEVATLAADFGAELARYFEPRNAVRDRVRSIESGLPDALALVGRRVADGV